MNPDDPYPPKYIAEISSVLNPDLSSENVVTLVFISVFLIILIVLSALFSASENALFSLSASDKESLADQENASSKYILQLLSKPKHLLATILVGNNFINVTFVIVSSIWLEKIFNFKANPFLDFAIKAVVVTLLLLLFGEVIPKVYATRKNLVISRLMAFPLFICQKVFGFMVVPMVKFTSVIDKKVRRHEHIVSADELTHAIDITTDQDAGYNEKEILKGIVSFGNKTVRQIMKGRMDVAAIESGTEFRNLLGRVNELGYSRFPVYTDSFDNIEGILYIKDLLPHVNEKPDYHWQALLKPPFFVPDNKRIDLLLSEFQEERMHMAIVVDEHGGKLGIVTMEDILEEIFGEINDEFDEEPLSYSKLDENKYIVEGKLLINDFCKITNTEDDYFDKVKGESETIAGLLLELNEKIPSANETIEYADFLFTIESVDNRRIKRIKVEIKR